MSHKTDLDFDFAIVGGGIVGASTAWQLKQRFADKSIVLIEKESELASHQTGHNSGVIHAGVYYAPGSLKAEFCKQGACATIAFCKQFGIKYENCGKLLVATDLTELERMKALYERCLENGIDVELLDDVALTAREPNVQGLGAIYVKATSIVDYRVITQKMVEQFVELGGVVQMQTELVSAQESAKKMTLHCREKENAIEIQVQQLVACTGLMADRVTKMLGINRHFQIVPYRGEYYRLANRHSGVVKHLIYPIPDPELPFLGVHLTRMIDGSVTVGPNAVQGWKREGYGRLNFSWRDTLEMLCFSGFWKASFANFSSGIGEWIDSFYKVGYLKRVNKYCKKIQLKDLEPHPAGIRAQAVLEDGTLVHDFLFEETSRSLHICNAPSPAATSAIPIGEHICDKIEERLQKSS
jgi:L-2-hydroxyglutarate oxidase